MEETKTEVSTLESNFAYSRTPQESVEDRVWRTNEGFAMSNVMGRIKKILKFNNRRSSFNVQVKMVFG